MDTYSFLRELADSWVLLAMTVFYIGAILWALRPGAKKTYEDIGNIPFQYETPRCTGGCPGCACAGTILALDEAKP